MLKVIAACGNGMGSSQIIKTKIDKVFKKLGIEAKIEHNSVGAATSMANNFDVVFVSQNFVDNFKNAASKGTKIIGLKNLLSEQEIEEKIIEAGLVEKEENSLDTADEQKRILHFYADWCGPCKMLEPILKEFEKEIEIIHINVDENQDVAEKYNVMSIPTLVLLKGEEEIERNVGVCDKQFLREWII